MTDLAPVGGQAAEAGGPRSGRNFGRQAALDPDQNATANRFTRLLALGAAIGLATMAITTTGDLLAAGVLLGLAASDLVAGSVGVVVGIAVIGRWGASSFAALAGGQAVVGAAGWSGPPGMILSSWAAAAAVVLVCPRRPTMHAATDGYAAGVVAGGLLAAALVAGPAVGRETESAIALRVVASALGVVAAVVVGRAVPPAVARVAALVAAVSAAGLAVLA